MYVSKSLLVYRSKVFSRKQSPLLIYGLTFPHSSNRHLDCYRPHTEYDGKVMFSVCLFTGGGAPGGTPPPTGGGGAPPGGTPPTGGGHPPNWGGPRGYPPKLGGGIPGGTPPPTKKMDKKKDKVLDKKMDKILDTKLDKHFGHKIGQTFWKLLEVGGRGRYASCRHAGGLSC